MHGGLSPDLQSMEQIRRVMRPTDVPDTGITYFYPLSLCLTKKKKKKKKTIVPLVYDLQVYYAIFFGLILTKILLGGVRMIEE